MKIIPDQHDFANGRVYIAPSRDVKGYPWLSGGWRLAPENVTNAKFNAYGEGQKEEKPSKPYVLGVLSNEVRDRSFVLTTPPIQERSYLLKDMDSSQQYREVKTQIRNYTEVRGEWWLDPSNLKHLIPWKFRNSAEANKEFAYKPHRPPNFSYTGCPTHVSDVTDRYRVREDELTDAKIDEFIQYFNALSGKPQFMSCTGSGWEDFKLELNKESMKAMMEFDRNHECSLSSLLKDTVELILLEGGVEDSKFNPNGQYDFEFIEFVECMTTEFYRILNKG